MDYVESKGKFILFSLTFLPQFPKSNYGLTETDKTIHNIIFYTSRAFHFARSYANHLETILDNFDDSIKLKTKYAIENKITYEFDAFVTMSKSILEGNSQKRINFSNQKLQKHFKHFAKGKFNNFVKIFLTPIRDEIIHINNMGTSWGNSIEFQNFERTKFKITSYHRIDSKNFNDLHELFLKVLEGLLQTLEELFSIFFTHYIISFGKPNENITIQVGEEKISLNNFQILNF